jgi:2-amino-4-hydroxy-6-hydroxymethyldihydropteridine diphosphokinase
VKIVAYIALGSNLDNPKMQIQDAFAELDEIENTHLLQTSSLYASAPWGYADQPDFVNAVAAVETELPPRRLLEELLKIETWHGRARSFANAPRTLDLDIALYGDEIVDEESLKIPHPRMHERAFVLVPLAEIAPDLVIPRQGVISKLLERCSDPSLKRMVD